MAVVTIIGVPRTSDPREMAKWFQKVSQSFSYQTYAGDPTGNIKPRWTGDQCLDTTNSDWYKSIGETSADWKQVTA